MRFILVTFKIGYQCLNILFGSQPQTKVLLPGVEFPDTDIEEYKNNEDTVKSDSPYGFEYEDDNIGNFKCFKLTKFEKAFISNLAKDTEYYLLLFKIMSKLFRSCRIVGEARVDYSKSPFRMDNEEPLASIQMSELNELIEPSENNLNILFNMKCSYKVIRNEVALLYGHIFWNEERSIGFAKNMIVSINHEEFKDILNYEQILYTILTLEDQYTKERINAVLNLCK